MKKKTTPKTKVTFHAHPELSEALINLQTAKQRRAESLDAQGQIASIHFEFTQTLWARQNTLDVLHKASGVSPLSLRLALDALDEAQAKERDGREGLSKASDTLVRSEQDFDRAQEALLALL
jgi:hypothetical protein